ncbi:hypothetical protein SK128_010963, partial [Halocaridina rubra]
MTTRKDEVIEVKAEVEKKKIMNKKTNKFAEDEEIKGNTFKKKKEEEATVKLRVGGAQK